MSLAFFDAVHADPWAKDFVDLPSLNARASGAIEESIEHVRRTALRTPNDLRSTSLVVLGPPGAGKTHLFSRLRRRLGPRAVFVHVRPLVHAEMTARFVLGEIVRQLAYVTPQGISQASALVGSLLGQLGGVGAGFPSAVLSEYTELQEPERQRRLEAALERILTLWPETEETYLRRLLEVPFVEGPTRRALLAWLSGRDCDAAQLERIGAAVSLGEEHAFGALRTLSGVAALAAPLVVAFDQLENLIDAGGAGPRLRAYAHLSAECVDTLRGCVFVHLALDSEWDRGIEPTFNLAQRSRIVMRREVLALPRAAEREELLRLFFGRVPSPREAFPWPLGAARLEALKVEPGMTPRMLLLELRRALEGDIDDVVSVVQSGADGSISAVASEENAIEAAVSDPAEPFGPAQRDIAPEWQRLLASAREFVQAAGEERLPLDAARLADGLLAAGRFLLEGSLSPEKTPPVQLALDVGGEKTMLAVLQDLNHKSVGAALTKLTALAAHTRVIALRERARELPPTWKETLRRREALLATRRARWVDLDPEDCARLLALSGLLQAARSGDITDMSGRQMSEADVCSWVKAELEVTRWPALAELVPSGEAPGAPLPVSSPRAGAAPDERAMTASAASGAGSRIALATLRRLRVASFERLVREVVRLDPGATRASVLAELAAGGESVRWIGRSVVYLRLTEWSNASA